MQTFIRTLCDKNLLTMAIKVALVVGTILIAINYGDQILAGHWQALNPFKVALTYCVPFCVSSYSAAMHKLNSAKTSPK